MPPPRVYKADAIVLRQRRLGEADRIVSLFTPEGYRIEAVAKGVLKPTSRMGGHLEVLNRCSLLLAQGRSLDVVTQAQAVETFDGLRSDLQRLSAGLYVAELVDRFTEAGPTNEPDGRVYHLLLSALRLLEEGAQELGMVCRFFEMRLLDALGYRPQLAQCVSCGQPLEPRDQYFAPGSGGALCPECPGPDTGAVRALSLNALKVLRLLQTQPFAEAARLRVSAALAAELEGHMREAVHYALDRDIRSAAFMDRVRRPAGT